MIRSQVMLLFRNITRKSKASMWYSACVPGFRSFVYVAHRLFLANGSMLTSASAK